MNKKLLLILMVLLLMILAACSPTAEQGQGGGTVVETAVPTEQEQEGEAVETAVPTEQATEEPAEAACPEPGEDSHQLVYAAQGICFLYPEAFDVSQVAETGSLILYVRSLLNTEAPLVTIDFEAANGRAVEDVAAEFLATFGLPELQTREMTLGGERAIVIDNLPGQDVNRRLFAIHEGIVYNMMVARIGPDYGEVGEQAEAVFSQITSTFQFIEIEPDAALVAGPECPEAEAGTILYTNAEDGYCLLLPEGYTADDSLTTENGGGETAVFVDSIQNTAHPRLFITVEDAQGQTLDEVTTAREAGIEAGFEGFDVMYTFGFMVDGVAANQFDMVPGQDLSRQVIFVQDGRVYTLTFIPDDPEMAEVYAEMETLYELVMGSFSFLME